MFIRSQNKQDLVNMNTINGLGTVGYGTYNIYAVINDGQCLLGKYSTKEKAIRVLDIIEERTNEPIYINDIGGNEYAKYYHSSFQMPQDDEVKI
jgi:acetyl-CoA carboxylase carboxyltransferase component